jgi:PAS domain S-box-containing protein
MTPSARSAAGASAQAAASPRAASATLQGAAPRAAGAGRRFTSSPVVSSGFTADLEGTTADALLRSAFEQSPHGMSVSALDGRWLRINVAYCRMLGYRSADLLGGSYSDVTHPDDADGDTRFIADAIAGRRDSMEREKRYVRKDGSILWARTRVEVIRDAHRSPMYFVSHVQDLSAHRATLDLLHDSERTLRSVIDNTPAMISVKGRDHRYRLVNREFVDVFAVDGAQIIGRSDIAVLPRSMIAAERAKDLLVLDSGKSMQEEQTITRGDQKRVLSITRFALRDEEGKVDAVCAAATDITDRRLEEHVKRERLQCSELIHSAIAKERFVLHGQPIVSLKSGQPITTELLIRMRQLHGGSELIAPAAFLPAAERFDLIQPIDQWVVDRAIEFAAAGHNVSVNLSAQTISNPEQVDRIRAAIISSGVRAENLIFEITETAVADNLDAAHAFATGIRELGCAIALDDFGVGHGTFTYLRHLRVDYLKIDRQFVRDLLSDEEDRQVVDAIIGVAHQFNVETIAEGVEDQATLEELRRIGVDHAQGYWTGRPAFLPRAWNAGPSSIHQSRLTCRYLR